MLFSELAKMYLADKRDGRKAVRPNTYAQDTSRCVILNARGNSLYIRNKNGVALGADQWYMGQVVTSFA